MALGSITIKMIIGLIALLTVTRLLGKKEMSEVTPYDFAYSLILGEIIGEAIYDPKLKWWFILYTAALWGILIYIIEVITKKFRVVRKQLKGNSSILIRKGKIDLEEIDKNHLEMEQLLILLRNQGIFSIREVEYAILEANGSLSVLKKPEYAAPSMDDLGVKEAKPVYLPYLLVDEGEILEDALKEACKEKSWLLNELEDQGIQDMKDVYFAEWKEDEGFFIIRYSEFQDQKSS